MVKKEKSGWTRQNKFWASDLRVTTELSSSIIMFR